MEYSKPLPSFFISEEEVSSLYVKAVAAVLSYTKKGCILAFFGMQPFLLFFYSALVISFKNGAFD